MPNTLSITSILIGVVAFALIAITMSFNKNEFRIIPNDLNEYESIYEQENNDDYEDGMFLTLKVDPN